MSSSYLQFSTRLRELRKQQKLSLQDLAQRSDVSKSMLSKIERGEVQPTIESASRIAEGLKTTLSDMLRTDTSNKVVLLPKSQQLLMSDDGHERRVLSPNIHGSNTEIFRESIAPGRSTGRFPPHEIGSEEFILLFEGSLDAYIDNEKSSLMPGDTLYFQAHVSHEFVNTGDAPAVFIIVINR